jgi:hypothetical protein
VLTTTDGQLSDLLALFREHGFPSNRTGGDIELASYVFNGDFVDRGAQQVEVVALLFSLKVCFPDRVFLLRGNHEFRNMNVHMTEGGGHGFDAACNQSFGSQLGPVVFESVHRRAPTSQPDTPAPCKPTNQQSHNAMCTTPKLTRRPTPSAPSIGCLSPL